MPHHSTISFLAYCLMEVGMAGSNQVEYLGKGTLCGHDYHVLIASM